MPEEPRALVPAEQITPEIPSLETLLPNPSMNGLTAVEAEGLQQFQTALVVLGQAAGGLLVCPGNQVGIEEQYKCPYASKCQLLKLQKAPQGELCPIERELVLARFNGWCQTINADPKLLREDQRSVVAELTYIDVQEQRCTNILSRGEAARLTQISVKDTNPETGEYLAWERVVHSNVTILESLHTRKRLIMKEWLLTPEQKFKVAKALNQLGQGNDLGKKLSARADKLKSISAEVLDAEYVDEIKP